MYLQKKTKVMTFEGKNLVRSKVLINLKNLRTSIALHFSRCDVSFKLKKKTFEMKLIDFKLFVEQLKKT